MGRCPVCGKDNVGLLCTGCGFDGSCDFEQYPTLGALSTAPRALSALRKKQEQEWNDFLRCGVCGGRAFRFNRKKNTAVCMDCFAEISADQIFSKAFMTELLEKFAVDEKKKKGKTGAEDFPRGGNRHKIAAGTEYTLCLQEDGEIAAAGENPFERGLPDRGGKYISVVAG